MTVNMGGCMLFVTVYCCSIIYSKTESNESNGSKECEQQELGEIENTKFQCMPHLESPDICEMYLQLAPERGKGPG